MQIKISDQTLEWFREAYTQQLDDWFDDPDEQFTAWSHAECKAWYESMLTIGEQIGWPFWFTVEQLLIQEDVTDYEINRVKTMLKKVGVSEFQDYESQYGD